MRSVLKLAGLSVGLLCAALGAGVAHAADEAVQFGPRVVGWIEKGLILPEYTAVKIKVDSGALTSSMHAVNLEEFEHHGKEWVRYDVPVRDADTDEMVTMHFERPVFRRILVRGAGGADRRPVVKMSICMGDRVYEEQFSLRDRGDMNYPVLIGRRTIEHVGLIDVSRTFMHKPNCSEDDYDQERQRQHDREENGAGNQPVESATEAGA